MDEARGKIIEKIIKVRALWASDMKLGHKNEGMNAKARADEMMEKYGITEADLRAGGDFTWSVPKSEPETPQPERPKTWKDRMWEDMMDRDAREKREANRTFECQFDVIIKNKSIYDKIVLIINEVTSKNNVKIIKLNCEERHSGPYGMDVQWYIVGVFSGNKDNLVHIASVIQYALIYMQQQNKSGNNFWI